MMTSSDMASLTKYEVYLTHEQWERLHAVDKEWIGSEHYMGIAYFWNYEYRFFLRDATAYQRVMVHREMLRQGLDVEGESPLHLHIVRRYCKS